MSNARYRQFTLAHVLHHLERDESLTANRSRDLISAVNRTCELLGRPASDLPAAAPDLRTRLAKLHPAQAGIRAKTLSNLKSNLTAALVAAGAMLPTLPKAEPTAGWQRFVACVSRKQKHQIYVLSRFITYCCHQSLEPAQVNAATMAAFKDYLQRRLITKDPEEYAKEVAQTWNGIIRRNGLKLTEIDREQDNRYRCRPLSDYPESLGRDLQGYLDRLAHVDPLAEHGPDKPLRMLSLRNVEAHVRQYLDALVGSGIPIRELTDLNKAVTAEHMKRAFTAIMGRRGLKEPPCGLHNIAGTLLAIARHLLELPEGEIEAIKKLKRRVTNFKIGMSEKNKARLTQFNDWENIARLVTLPAVLMERAEANPDARASALDAMHAAETAILLACPMRVKNLAGLDLDRHLITQRHGTHTRYTIHIEGREVKNGVPIEVQLSANTSKLLHKYITRFRGQLSSHTGTALFPRRSDGRPRSPGQLGQHLGQLIYQETGLRMNTHLFRHFAAKLYLKEKPGDYETVRRLLKHKKLDTTVSFYAEFSSQWAHDHYDETVLSKWGGK